jgi:hypothetical protein
MNHNKELSLIKPSLYTAILGVLTLGNYNKTLIEDNYKVYEQKYNNKINNFSFTIKSH